VSGCRDPFLEFATKLEVGEKRGTVELADRSSSTAAGPAAVANGDDGSPRKKRERKGKKRGGKKERKGKEKGTRLRKKRERKGDAAHS
jgi:hypothetical protein